MKNQSSRTHLGEFTYGDSTVSLQVLDNPSESRLVQYTKLRDLSVSVIGLGCMGMSHIYTGHNQSEKDSIRTIHRAMELGVTHFDSAEIYGPFTNEVLLGKAMKGRRDDVVLTSKFGMITHTGNPGPLDSSAANIRAAVEGSLRRLNTDYIDLYYQHRVDKIRAHRRRDRYTD